MKLSREAQEMLYRKHAKMAVMRSLADTMAETDLLIELGFERAFRTPGEGIDRYGDRSWWLPTDTKLFESRQERADDILYWVTILAEARGDI